MGRSSFDHTLSLDALDRMIPNFEPLLLNAVTVQDTCFTCPITNLQTMGQYARMISVSFFRYWWVDEKRTPPNDTTNRCIKSTSLLFRKGHQCSLRSPSWEESEMLLLSHELDEHSAEAGFCSRVLQHQRIWDDMGVI